MVLPISVGTATASYPSAASSSLNPCKASTLRAAKTSLQPASAKLQAVARPMPWVAPVRIITRSLGVITLILRLSDGGTNHQGGVARREDLELRGGATVALG